MTDPKQTPEKGPQPMATITSADGEVWEEAIRSEYPEPGMYEGVPSHIYNNTWKLPRQSRLKVAVMRTPAHAKFEEDNPGDPTAALEMGTALHTLILEPELFEESVVIGPTATRTAKAWVAMAAEVPPGTTILSAAEYEKVQIMGRRLLELEEVRKLNSPKLGAHRELSVVADLAGIYPAILDADTHPYTLRVKGRLDWLLWPRLGWYVDIKTTRDASEDAFNKSVFQYGYHIQGAFYERVMAALGIEIKRVMFAIVENTAPFEPVFRELQPEAMDRGRVLVSKSIAHWAWCLEHNQYPGYPPGIGSANLPKWALPMGAAHSAWDEELSE